MVSVKCLLRGGTIGGDWGGSRRLFSSSGDKIFKFGFYYMFADEIILC